MQALLKVENDKTEILFWVANYNFYLILPSPLLYPLVAAAFVYSPGPISFN